MAEPFAVDPYFKRSVVLLCEHDDEGTVGFIINKALELDINELVGEFGLELDRPTPSKSKTA